jgi:hypothetical protein
MVYKRQSLLALLLYRLELLYHVQTLLDRLLHTALQLG